MMGSSSGMSLIELVVSMAIITIFGAAVIFFFSTTLSSTTKVDTDNTVHMEAQSAWNQMRNDIQNSNAGIYSDGTNLVLYRKTPQVDESTGEAVLDGSGNPIYKKAERTVYTFDSTSNQLKYNYYTADFNSGAWTNWANTDGELVFAGFVSDLTDADGNALPGFEVSIKDSEGTELSGSTLSDKTPKSVQVTIRYLNDKAKTETVKNVTIRNKMKWVPGKDGSGNEMEVYPSDVVN